MISWSEEETNFLLSNYEHESNDYLAHILKKTKKAIDSKANKLGLKKDQLYISNTNKKRVSLNRWKEKSWTKSEIDTLVKNIDSLSNEELSNMLSRSKDSIVSMCRRLNIQRKTKYNKEYIESECLKYITKSEMRLVDPNLYHWLHKNGKIKDLTSHMMNVSYSTPQLILAYILKVFNKKYIYNDRKVISPYEIDIFFKEYNLGFEYDGKYYHPEASTLKINLCLKKDIKLIVINEDNLIKRNFESYVRNIKDQILKNIHDINQYLKTDISTEELISYPIDKSEIFKNIFEINEIKRICDKYKNYSDFIRDERKTYNKIRYLGLLDEFTKHMRLDNISENLKYIIEKKKFYNVGDVILIEYWYNGMICPVRVLEHVGRKFKVSHNVEGSKIKNAPDELVTTNDIIDHYRTDSI